MTTIRRSISKYPFFYTTLSLGVLGLVFRLIDKFGISDLLFILSALVAMVVGFNRMLYILRHGFFGISVLPLIGIISSLLLAETETAAILALLFSIEQSAFSWVQTKSTKKISLLQMKHVQLVRFLDTATLPFVVLVVLIGGAVWTISGDANRFLEVVVAATSFPLLLAPALGILHGINKLHKQGVNVTNAVLFEKLAEVKTVILRKSIALTRNELEVTAVQAIGKHTKADVLRIAAALASQSVHRVSTAIVAYTGAAQKVNRAKHTTEVDGQGITGRMKGSELIIGRPSFLQKHGVTIGSVITQKDGPEVYVGQDGDLLGVITLQEAMLPGTKNLQRALLKTGIAKIILISGSSNKAVASIAKLAGIKHYYGDTVSNDVIDLIEREETKPIAFIGDSVRDEAISTAADVSITVNETTQRSAVNLVDYSPAVLVSTFEIAKRTFRSTQIEVFVLLLVSLLFILVAATGKIQVVHLSAINLIFLATYITITAFRYSKVKDLQQ